ncbi:MAG: pyrroline-5-carboxylate reductase [Firmicutes bacterium]|nr:pyrroline-5-carboxylate reductase [Bacillota bacterium]
MRKRVGFIGVGAMGGALLKGLLDSGVTPENIVIADDNADKLQQVADTYQISHGDVRGVAETADVIFLAVKPQDMAGLLAQMSPIMQSGQVVVSVAAGVTIDQIEQSFVETIGVIRVMPNTPCLIGEGVMAMSAGQHVPDEVMHTVESWLQKLGLVHRVPEKLLDAVTGVSGSGPAYVYLMIEALADGGVMSGLPRAMAQLLAVQTLVGAAKMVEVSGQHPAILREMVTSPGGTTAAALFEFEQGGFRGLVQKAVQAATERSKEMGI